MRRRFAVQLRIALWALLLAFIIGLPLLFSQARIPTREEGGGGGAGAQVLARVNDEVVPKSTADRLFERGTTQLLQYYAAAGQPLGMETLWRFRLDAMGQAVEQEILLQEAGRLGVSVSKGEVKQRVQDMIDQELAYYKSQLQREALEQYLVQVAADAENRVARQGDTMSERQFRKWRLETYTDPASGLRNDMTIERLQQSVVGPVSVTEEDLLQSYDAATLRRILVSLRPAGGDERTEEQARERAEELLAQVNQGANFAALAKSESDDPEAEQTGGLMEGMRPGWLPAEWDRAVFSLQPGEVSGVIEGPQGYEIVKLEERSRQLPEDFEQNKEQLLSDFANRQRDRVWGEYVADLAGRADIEIVDKEMSAYRALTENRQEEALALLRDAVPQAQQAGGLGAAALFYELATLLASQNEWEEAAEFYAQSDNALSWGRGLGERLPSGRAQALLGMGQAYEKLGETEEAVMWYTAAGNVTEVPSIHAQLRSTFERLGEEELAEEEKEWMDRYEQRQREREEELAAQQQAFEEQQPGPQPSPAPESPAQWPDE
jgi:parvulin-like peptidyl-prolyl isomerase